jgi:Putative zinc-finger
VAGRESKRRAPTLSHQAVREHLVDYHFGRLSAQMNDAVERHVRACEICQREGMVHLATQKREAVRKVRRSLRHRGRSGRLRLIALCAALALLALFLLYASDHGYLAAWLSSLSSASDSLSRLGVLLPT